MGRSGENIPDDLRNRRPVRITISDATRAGLAELGKRWELSRSRVIDRLVAESITTGREKK